MAVWDPITESFDVERPDPDDREPDPVTTGADDPETAASEECWHLDTRIEEEVGTGRTFTVCEDCDAVLPDVPAPY